MPVRRGVDHHGTFFQWGYHGKKYYYSPFQKKSREKAEKDATKQGRAVQWRKHSKQYDMKDGSERGKKRGGRRKNKTDNCRHKKEKEKNINWWGKS